jgi:hypothetical protein
MDTVAVCNAACKDTSNPNACFSECMHRNMLPASISVQQRRLFAGGQSYFTHAEMQFIENEKQMKMQAQHYSVFGDDWFPLW